MEIDGIPHDELEPYLPPGAASCERLPRQRLRLAAGRGGGVGPAGPGMPAGHLEKGENEYFYYFMVCIGCLNDYNIICIYIYICCIDKF